MSDEERILKAEILVRDLQRDKRYISQIYDRGSTDNELSLEIRQYLAAAELAASNAISVAESRLFHLKRAIWKRQALELGMEVT